jgi:hypothetical protein
MAADFVRTPRADRMIQSLVWDAGAHGLPRLKNNVSGRLDNVPNTEFIKLVKQ